MRRGLYHYAFESPEFGGVAVPQRTRAAFALIVAAWGTSFQPAEAQPTLGVPRGPGLITNPPGSIVSAEPFAISVPRAKAWRIVYRSGGINSEQIQVSGVIVAPDRAAPSDGWPVVAWAHPTTGIARQCAPSLRKNFTQSIPDLAEMVRRGYVVAATDYEGLGFGGPHPYLVGSSAAHTILDSVRAARLLTGAGSRFVVWGHSQGGHAALWTGQLAQDYATDLTLLGVAAMAPASDLTNLIEANLETPAGKAFTALALVSWSKVYGYDLRTVANPKAIPGMQVIAGACMDNPLGLLADKVGLGLLPKQQLVADPTKTPPWSIVIAANTPSTVAGAPVLLAQGTADTLIKPPITERFARQLCRTGSPVRLVEMNADHLSIATRSADRVLQWTAARFGGAPAESDCAAIGAR